jgi:putative transposase
MSQGLVRYHQTGNFHFLNFSCYHRLPYLTTPSAREAFEESLERMRIRYKFVIAGYVVMPEHIHLLLSEPQIGTISTAIQALKLSVTRQRSERPFWQVRYYDFTVRSSKKTAEKLRYIHRNPVARGLVSKPGKWPWSSFRHYCNGERGRVEIESVWTAAARGYELPEGFEVKRIRG